MPSICFEVIHQGEEKDGKTEKTRWQNAEVG